MSSIKAVVSEPIEGHEEYHIMVSFILVCGKDDAVGCKGLGSGEGMRDYTNSVYRY